MTAQFARITEGPYASQGRYAVRRHGDRRLRGIRSDTGKAWSRPPYYGHVWREGHIWRATLAGGTPLGTFPTRSIAGAAVLNYGTPA